MPKPRKQQIALCETPYYHLISRCVRRAFLCGCAETCNFEHRRGWILDRLHLLAQMFAVDIAAFALMSNCRYSAQPGYPGRHSQSGRLLPSGYRTTPEQIVQVAMT